MRRVRVLALDFDGVLSDSAPEAFWVALRTFVAEDVEGDVAALADRLGEGDRPPTREQLESEPLYRDFVEAMPLGNRAEDFGAVLRALAQETPLPDQAAYDAHRADLDDAWLDDFHARFYAVRSELARALPEAWRALLGPYPDFLELLHRRAGDALYAVATAKDRASVDLLLADYGVRELFAPEYVLDKEAGPDKRAHLTALSERTGIGFPDITFVDDKVNHLEGVASLGVRCVLAGWGYNGEREWRLARERGFAVCQLADAEAGLFA